MSTVAQPPRVNILGVQVAATDMEQSVQLISRLSTTRARGGPAYVCATSVHGIVEAHRDPSFRQILNKAALVTADGMPLVWGARLQGYSAAERVYGPALMKSVCAATAGKPIRHFFYGGGPGVADELSRRLRDEFPGLEVAGAFCPPFRQLSDDELDTVADLIASSEADIVWVGLSTPKQERWICSIRERLRAGVLISVGAAFDFHTERVATAPAWMQRVGLEWLFRLAQEPGRLWRRYAINNPAFVALALLQITGLRRFDYEKDRP